MTVQGTEPWYRQLLVLSPVFHQSKNRKREDDRAILSRCERRLKPQSDDKMSYLWVFIVNGDYVVT